MVLALGYFDFQNQKWREKHPRNLGFVFWVIFDSDLYSTMVNSSSSNSPPFGIIFFGTFSKHLISKSKEIERMDPLIAGRFVSWAFVCFYVLPS